MNFQHLAVISVSKLKVVVAPTEWVSEGTLQNSSQSGAKPSANLLLCGIIKDLERSIKASFNVKNQAHLCSRPAETAANALHRSPHSEETA